MFVILDMLRDYFCANIYQDEDFDVFVDTPNSGSSTTTDGVLFPQTYHSFPFGSGAVDVTWMQPTHPQMQFYWTIYCERVDPLIKVLHKPSIETILLVDLGTSDKSMTALLFAICFSAVSSLTDTEVMENLSLNRTDVVKNYKFAAEQALVNANLTETQEIVTLQAFVIYLVCNWSNGEVKSVWSMSGLAMRLALSMGLHRDPSYFGLNPLEI
jgi:hypothetical protein